MNGSTTLTVTAALVYQRMIVIDHTKVPNTDQGDFPVLISGTYSYLATAGNGGKVMVEGLGDSIGNLLEPAYRSDRMSW